GSGARAAAAGAERRRWSPAAPAPAGALDRTRLPKVPAAAGRGRAPPWAGEFALRGPPAPGGGRPRPKPGPWTEFEGRTPAPRIRSTRFDIRFRTRVRKAYLGGSWSAKGTDSRRQQLVGWLTVASV